jgi:hypothetical protein
VHENQLHAHSCFVTLTYSDENLPPNGSLRPRDMVLFMKKLRKKFGKGIRFFQCGEYGGSTGRAHHHALLFGLDFPDKYFWTQRDGYRYYRSPSLEALWPQGNSLITDVTFESAAYVARYITKKITGDAAEEHYKGRVPEYITMSRRPGIAAGWFEKYKTDVYPSDEVIIRGKKMRPPRYYDKLFDVEDSAVMSRIKRVREKRAAGHKENNTEERLAVREIVQLARFKKLKRGYENG